MSGLVSYDLFNQRTLNSKIGFTAEGGLYEVLTNNTGGSSLKGTIVIASVSVADAVDIAPANTGMPIGVIYENEIPNGSPVKVVIYGRAQVLLKNTLSSTIGYWCGVSDVAGRMYQSSTIPDVTQHNREIGHSLQTVSGGTNVLAYINLHFN
ncbi:hypothetical protein RBG61_01495 [Paludicola sp. MB14-C6]|uniref:hypothetical protein n=1 Tax=Paludihabitans sp. MB14-C6 TaxID=3070656 RepID=UPI0027DB886D|nr:hypothetical protein [Paludicola sp. MB14-C6]WMJ23364.1 hypothetical protein RBG61_01495 [Paludicola sp. MB14-C6]